MLTIWHCACLLELHALAAYSMGPECGHSLLQPCSPARRSKSCCTRSVDNQPAPCCCAFLNWAR